MAIIPRANPGQVQTDLVGIGARNETRVSNAASDAINAGTQAAVQGLTAFAKVSQRSQDKADIAGYQEAQREGDAWEEMTNDPNNPKGFYSYKGRDALGLKDALLPEFDKRFAEIGAKLSPRAQEKFKEYADGRRHAIATSANSYATREYDGWRDANSKAWETGQRNNIGRAYQSGSEDEAVKLLGGALETMAAESIAEGRPMAELTNRQAAFTSDVHASILNGMLVSDPMKAREYFDTHKDELLENVRPGLEAKVQVYGDDARAEKVAEESVAGVRVTREAPSDYAEYRRRLESGGNNNAKNPNSSATGADQFVRDTWLGMVRKVRPVWADAMSEEQVLSARTDPHKSAEMAAALDGENTAALQRAGVAVTNETLYAAHHFGAAGGVKFGQAAGDTPMAAILSPAAIKANPYLADMTKAETVANWSRRAGGKATAKAPPATLGEAIALVRADPRLDTPQLRKAAETKVRSRWQVMEADKIDAKNASLGRANLAIETADPATPLRQILGGDFEAMAMAGYVDSFEKRLTERRTGVTVASNPNVVAAMEEGIYRARAGGEAAQAALRAMNPYDPTLQLAPADQKRLGEAKLALLSGDAKQIAKAATEAEFGLVIRQYRTQQMKLTDEAVKKDEGKRNQAIEFDQSMRAWRDEFTQANDRAPTYLEVRKQADTLTLSALSFDVPGRMFGTNTESVADLQIPADMQPLIVEALQSEGVPVTGQAVANKWRAYLRQQAK